MKEEAMVECESLRRLPGKNALPTHTRTPQTLRLPERECFPFFPPPQHHTEPIRAGGGWGRVWEDCFQPDKIMQIIHFINLCFYQPWFRRASFCSGLTKRLTAMIVNSQLLPLPPPGLREHHREGRKRVKARGGGGFCETLSWGHE